MYCPNCGKEVSDTALFCSACGEQLPRAVPQSATEPSRGAVPLSPVSQPDPWSASPAAPVSTTNYAGFWLRFVAYILDAIIVVILVVAVAFALGFVTTVLTGTEPTDATAEAWGGILALVVPWFYFAFTESSSHQATLGKRVAGIIVTDESGRRVSFARATARYWAKVISRLILFIGFIVAAFTQRKQALHDLIAGTLVLRKPGT